MEKIEKMKRLIFLAVLMAPVFSFAQQQKEADLGGKEYIIVKDYKPVLAESYKISDSPEGDTNTVESGALKYSIRSKRAESEYETATIKAVKIKDEQLAKLYRSYVKLGLGNYTTYNGELCVNSLRSKKGALNFNLRHFSADPGLGDVGPAGFSQNQAGVNGRYFLENSTFTGDFLYDRNVVHYYGYDTDDTIIDKDKIRQRFNQFGVKLGLGSNYTKQERIDYKTTFGFSSLSDVYGVSENEFIVEGTAGKKVNDYYVYGNLSFDFFKKSRADYELISLNNDLSRNIISFSPGVLFDKDKVRLDLGLNVTLEKNLDNSLRLFPRINLTLPIAENILYAFAGVNGGLVKNNYHTVSAENRFVNSAIVLDRNTANKIELKAGLNGNFSSAVSFLAMVRYTTVENMLLYVNDPVLFNKFNSRFLDGKVLNIHAELGYRSSEKLNFALRVDQFSYNMELSERAWHRPNTEVSLNANYSLREKLIVKAAIYGRGSFYARQEVANGFNEQKIKGFSDFNLGLEYRYSKILSLYVNLNNLGFSRYYYWYRYPTERFNLLGGLTYAF